MLGAVGFSSRHRQARASHHEAAYPLKYSKFRTQPRNFEAQVHGRLAKEKNESNCAGPENQVTYSSGRLHALSFSQIGRVSYPEGWFALPYAQTVWKGSPVLTQEVIAISSV